MSQIAKLLPNLEERMGYDHVPGMGIAVFKDSELEWAEGYGVMEAGTQLGITANSLFHACSISKMVTAIGVLRLVQEGVLDLEKDVNEYLVSWRIPDNKFTERKKVSLSNLLAHQAGFVDFGGSFDIYQEKDPLPTLNDILIGKTRYNPEPLQVSYIPESQFSYSDAGYCVVEQIIEDVTGESFADVMERLVMRPLGLKRTFFWNYYTDKIGRGTEAVAGHHQNGFTVEGKRAYYPYLAAAGLWTTPAELAALTLEVIKAWNGDSKSILNPDMARLMLNGYGCDKEVGLGVFVTKDEEELYIISNGWGVGFQCMLLAYPRLQSGIVVMTNSDPGKPQNESLVGEVIREIGKQYLSVK